MALFGKKKEDEKQQTRKTAAVSGSAEKDAKGEKGAAETKPAQSKENTGDAFKVLVRPLTSEKSQRGIQSGKYIFVVNRKANKIQIRNAVEKVYAVKVVQVNILNVRGKQRNFGRTSGHTSAWKKAIVTLKPGQIIGEAQV